MATLRLLGEYDVRSLVTREDALKIARAALRDQGAETSFLSTPSAMTLDAGRVAGPRFKFKAATVGGAGVSGIRLLCRPEDLPVTQACNHTAIYDHRTSTLVGLVSENWLSRIRTAAFGVAALEPLVASGPVVVGLFGAGEIAAEMVPLLAIAFEIAEIRVNSRRLESMKAFVERFRPLMGERIRVEPDRRAVVDQANLVVTLTEATEPLVQPGWLKTGGVICTMGSKNEVDFGVLAETDRLIVDDIDYASEMGDGAAWIAQGRLTRTEFEARVDALASEVVTGAKPGRLRASDRVLAIVQGMAIGDVAFAAHALRAAQKDEKGRTVELP